MQLALSLHFIYTFNKRSKSGFNDKIEDIFEYNKFPEFEAFAIHFILFTSMSNIYKHVLNSINLII